MKNLRKVLSLILVVAMAVSLMAVASAKDYKTFTDKADVSEQYTEAVDLISALGIFAGDENGALNPQGNFTRAQAAKIVTYMSIGSDAAERLARPATATFTDVPTSHWASKYIAYAYEKGILGGDGDGNFRPDDSVKGSEVAKLMNTVLGYGKMGEYTGASWELNAISDGIYRGLITGNAELSEPATREEVIQYVFNTINPRSYELGTGLGRNYYVDYSTIVGSYITSGSNFADTEKQTYIGREVFGLDAEFGADASGHPVHTWVLGAREITDTYKDKQAEYSFTNGAAIWDTAADTKSYDRETTSKLKFSDSGYSIPGGGWEYYGVDVYYNGTEVSENKVFATADDFMTKTFVDAYGKDVTVNSVSGKGGVLTSIYLDRNGYVDRIVLIEKTFTEVQAAPTYSMGAISAIAGITSTSGDTFAGDTDVKKGDFVLYYKDFLNVIHVQKAEAVEGQLTKFTEGFFSMNSWASVVFGGKTYALSDLTGIRGYDSEGTLEVDLKDGTGMVIKTSMRVALTKTVNYNVDSVAYLDDNGSIICFTPGVGLPMNYIYLVQTGQDGFETWNQGRLVKTDGTFVVANIKPAAGEAAFARGTTGWFTYSEKDGVYTLTRLSASHKQTNNYAPAAFDQAAITNGSPTIKVTNAASVMGDNSTVFIFFNENNFSTRVYTGIKAVPTFNSTVVTGSGLGATDVVSALLTSTSKSTVSYVFIQTAAKGAGASNVVFFGSIEASAYTEIGDVDYVTWNSAYVNGDATASAIKVAKGTGMPLAVGLKNVSISDDVYSVNKAADGTDDMSGIVNGAAVVKPGNGVVTVVGDKTYAVASGAKIYEYANGAAAVTELSAIVTTASNGLDQGYKYWFTLNNAGAIDLLYLQKDADATAAPKFSPAYDDLTAAGITYQLTSDGYYSYYRVEGTASAALDSEAEAIAYIKSKMSDAITAATGVTVKEVTVANLAGGSIWSVNDTAYSSIYTVVFEWEGVTVSKYVKLFNLAPLEGDELAVATAKTLLNDVAAGGATSIPDSVDVSVTASLTGLKTQIEAYYNSLITTAKATDEEDLLEDVEVTAEFVSEPTKADQTATVLLTITSNDAEEYKIVVITGMTFTTANADAIAAANEALAKAEAKLTDATAWATTWAKTIDVTGSAALRAEIDADLTAFSAGANVANNFGVVATYKTLVNGGTSGYDSVTFQVTLTKATSGAGITPTDVTSTVTITVEFTGGALLS